MRVNITVPEELLKDANLYCKKNNLNRSELIRFLLRIEIYHEKSLDKETKD